MKKIKKIEQVNHLNYPDEKGKVFCRRFHKIRKMDLDGKFWNECVNCKMLAGSVQGEGVECLWNDEGDYVYRCYDPKEELLRVSKLIDKKVLKKINPDSVKREKKE